jgi:predicted Fe-Mo cluster-binding NifX family protein
MKICVTSQGNSLDSQVDPRFGRCQYFVFIEPETLKFEAVANPYIQAGGGAGIQSAQFVANKQTETVLTGNVGPNAFSTLQAGGVKIIVGVTGIVRDAVEKYKKGELNSQAIGPSVGSHFGMFPQSHISGMGRDKGMGRGMRWIPPQNPIQISKEQEIKTLREQAETLKKQIEEINKRIDELGKKEK